MYSDKALAVWLHADRETQTRCWYIRTFNPELSDAERVDQTEHLKDLQCRPTGNGCRIIESNRSDSPWPQSREGIICGHSLRGCVKLPSCPQTYFWKEPQLLNGTWAPLCVCVCVCVFVCFTHLKLEVQKDEDQFCNRKTFFTNAP